MFTSNTVFVLGAGASWHYGFPTGNGLVDGVKSMAERLARYCEARLQSDQLVQSIPIYIEQQTDATRGIAGARAGWERARDDFRLLNDRLNSVRPLLIDHFLAWNESLRPIGKLMVAAAILECDARWSKFRFNTNRPDKAKYDDDWYRFIVHKLVYSCTQSSDLLKNDVHFVTFNYDTSLEHHLYQALTSIDLVKESDVAKFLTEDRILHVYGSVDAGIRGNEDAIDFEVVRRFGEPFADPLDFEKEFGTCKAFLDRCLASSANLRTIDPHDKEDDESSLKCSRAWIEECNVIYILGYGFDQNNNRRIGLDPILKDAKLVPQKKVMFTNFGDMNKINVAASNLMFGSYDTF